MAFEDAPHFQHTLSTQMLSYFHIPIRQTSSKPKNLVFYDNPVSKDVGPQMITHTSTSSQSSLHHLQSHNLNTIKDFITKNQVGSPCMAFEDAPHSNTTLHYKQNQISKQKLGILKTQKSDLQSQSRQQGCGPANDTPNLHLIPIFPQSFAIPQP
jgi:hypothetical protein